MALRFSIPLVLLAVLTASSPAEAQEEPFDVDYVTSGAIIAGGLLGSYLINRAPVDTEVKWNRELLGPLDLRVRANFSATASRISDVTLTMSMAAPYVLTFIDGFDEDALKRAVIYSEALAVSFVPSAIAKVMINRPRPYTYSEASYALALKKTSGKDSHKSFYSGHSSTAFASAVASSILFASTTENEEARATSWGLQLALAAVTANLRVRAGKHFYSDVIVGGLFGTAIAWGVVAAHGDFYQPSVVEVAGMGAGLATGVIISALVPLDSPIENPETVSDKVSVIPLPVEGGFGLALSGLL